MRNYSKTQYISIFSHNHQQYFFDSPRLLELNPRPPRFGMLTPYSHEYPESHSPPVVHLNHRLVAHVLFTTDLTAQTPQTLLRFALGPAPQSILLSTNFYLRTSNGHQ